MKHASTVVTILISLALILMQQLLCLWWLCGASLSFDHSIYLFSIPNFYSISVAKTSLCRSLSSKFPSLIHDLQADIRNHLSGIIDRYDIGTISF